MHFRQLAEKLDLRVKNSPRPLSIIQAIMITATTNPTTLLLDRLANRLIDRVVELGDFPQGPVHLGRVQIADAANDEAQTTIVMAMHSIAVTSTRLRA